MCKYVLMCGGDYTKWEKPRQLSEINGEVIVERTIRLLRENGIKDIAITTSANNKAFDYLDVEVIHRENEFAVDSLIHGYWVDAFKLYEEPVCYIFGDVYFSEDAIRTIVNTETDDIEFFASAPPFREDYIKPWAEPFAFKVVNNLKFAMSIELTKFHCNANDFKRHPIAWELWQVIKGGELNVIDYYNYTAINDYTCDVDNPQDIVKMERALSENKVKYMIHTCKDREWYVKEFLVPSMVKQGIKPYNITVWLDDGWGCLISCMKSFESLPQDGHTWHLQDDVIISRAFKQTTEKYVDFDGLVCGICTTYDLDIIGHTNIPIPTFDELWFSFPCMRIPNKIAHECVEFFNSGKDMSCEQWRKQNKGDDSVFRRYIQVYYPKIMHINLMPNIVDHIDYLLGGSLVNSNRASKIVRAKYWNDNDLVKELERKLNERVQ